MTKIIQSQGAKEPSKETYLEMVAHASQRTNIAATVLKAFLIGGSICLFAVIAAVFTVVIPLMRNLLSAVMHAPKEAFSQTAAYICICGLGSAFIIACNLIGSIFRGIGDSMTPLMTVLIACAFNIAGDLLLVAVFHSLSLTRICFRIVRLRH